MSGIYLTTRNFCLANGYASDNKVVYVWAVECIQYQLRNISNVLTILVLELDYFGMIMSKPWLQMPWLLDPPGHQQPWYWIYRMNESLSFILGWVGLWGFLWWAPSAKRKDHHRVSSGWSSVWHHSNTGLSSTQFEQIPIWPFWLTPFFLAVNNILAGLCLNCISSVEITLFLLADILLQHRGLFQC